MLTSISRALYTRSLALLAAALLLGGLAGCADVVTYSQDARAEGLKLYNQGQYTDAAGSFRNAVRQEPRDYQSQYWLGQSYAQMGSHGKAITAFRSGLDSMKVTYDGQRDTAFRAKILDALAQTIAGSTQRVTEIENVERATAANPSAEQYLLLAKIYRYAGDHDMAIEQYSQALTVTPRDFATLKDFGFYLEQIGATEQAVARLSRANAINPQDIEVADALRRHHVVPGPSLKNPDELARPRMPDGPLPDFDLHRKQRAASAQAAPGNSTPDRSTPDSSAGYPLPSATVQAPRD